MPSRAMSFDTVAESYHEVRPRYPQALFDELMNQAQLSPGARILEVGAGSGIATAPLAARGFEVVALEPGEALAALARRNLAAYPNAIVHRISFERARLAPSSFDMIVSATAWHWVDPSRGSVIAARTLRPNGILALWWTGFSTLVDAFTVESDNLIRTWVNSPASTANGALWQHSGHSRTHGRSLSYTLAADIAANPEFLKLAQLRYVTTETYSPKEYTQLLGSYADFVLLPEWIRAGLSADLQRLIRERFHGSVTRTFVTTLYVWRRLPRFHKTMQS